MFGFLLLLGEAYADERIVDVVPSERNPVSLVRSAAVLEDPGAKLTLGDVQGSDIAARFAPKIDATDALNYGYTKSAYWLRFTLRNAGDTSVDRLVEVRYRGLARVELHIPGADGEYRSHVTGRLLPFASRAYPNRAFVFPVTLPKNSSDVYYLRVESIQPMQIPVWLWEPNAFHAYERNDYARQAVYFGVAAAMLALNLLLFVLMRDRIYLFYVAFVTCTAFAMAAQNGFTDEFMGLDLPYFSVASTNIGYSLALAALLLFMRTLLATKALIPKVDRILGFLQVIHLVSPVVFLWDLRTFGASAATLYFITVLFILGVAIYYAWTRQRLGIYFLVAYSFVCIGGALAFLRTQGLLPANALTVDGIQFGSAIEMLLFAFALGDRFIRLRGEREQMRMAASVSAERSAAAERIRESETRYRTLIEWSMEAIAVHRNGTVVYANPATVKLFGLESATEVIGKSILNFVHPDFHEIVLARAKEIMIHRDSVSIVGEMFLKADGTPMDVEVQATWILFDGEPASQVSIRDVTAAKRHAAEMSAARQHAEQANAAKTRVLAATGHDLRQPLQAIGLFNDALGRTALSAEQLSLQQKLSLSVESLQVLLNTLLDMSMLETGMVKPTLQRIVVEELFVRIDAEFSLLVANAGLRFKFFYPRRSMVLFSDPQLLLRLLGNLIVNAMKYTERGGVLIGFRRRGDRAVIQVWDTGIGIASEHVGDIFDEYFQVGNVERDSQNGLGLGLSIVRRLADLLGAEVRCYSRHGRGSLFEVCLPLDSGEAVAVSTPVTVQSSMQTPESLHQA